MKRALFVSIVILPALAACGRSKAGVEKELPPDAVPVLASAATSTPTLSNATPPPLPAAPVDVKTGPLSFAPGAKSADPSVVTIYTLGESEEFTERMGMLTNAMQDLNDREKAIFQARRLRDDPATLEELAQEYNVSRERIRQIEVRAFEKVQEAVQKAAHKPRETA